MRPLATLIAAFLSCLAVAAEAGKPLEVLLIAGGCCHDYATQTQILKKGIEARVRSHVTVAYSPDTSTKATFDIYGKPDWDKGYDVVIHDECSCDVTDRAYIERILAAHRRGKPAVNIHCAMHSYRRGDFRQPVELGADNADWFEMVGLQSASHGPQQPIEVVFTDRAHPVMKPLADWKTINEELYNSIRVMPTAKVLASGRQLVPPKPKQGELVDPAARPTEATAPVVWINEYGPNKTRIFSTSLGHNNDTVADDRYLDLVTRGLLWAAGRLDDDGRLTINRTPGGGAAVEVDGKPFATYVVDQTNKPYLWPIYGPTGKPMTRAYPMQDLPDEPTAQRDHPHHRGLTFGLESAGGDGWKFPEHWDGLTGDEQFHGGGDTWHDRSTFEEAMAQGKTPNRNRARIATLGRIVHREFTRLAADGDRAVIEEVCDHVDPAGHPFLVERRRLTFRATDQTRSIDIDQEFVCPQPRGDAAAGPVRIDDRKDSGLFIRVPTTMAVDSKQGGRIVNSDGLVDQDAWSKPARWCDYHGPVAGEHLGIAILNHPASHRHPTRWHVRTYGLFTANPFASRQYDPALPDGTTTIEPGGVLRLHHRFLFHKGDEKAGGVEEAWRAYAAETPPINTRDATVTPGRVTGSGD